MRLPLSLLAAALCVAVAMPADAQLGLGGGSGSSGLSGLTGGLGSGLGGGVLPNLSSQGTGNAAGVLSYCVKNKLFGANSMGSATSALGALTGKSGVTGSKDYQAGQSGQLLAGGNTLSLDSVKGKAKSKLCDMVLQHSHSLL